MNQLKASKAMIVSELRTGCTLKKIMSSEDTKKHWLQRKKEFVNYFIAPVRTMVSKGLEIQSLCYEKGMKTGQFMSEASKATLEWL
jgi:hypothetical protein